MLIGIFLAIGTLCLVLQTTLLHDLPAWLGQPDLLFLLIVFAATHLDLVRGAILALLLGLLMDIFSGIFLGLYPLTYLLVFFVLKGATRHLAFTAALHQVPLIVISYLFGNAAIYVITSILAPEATLSWGWGNMLQQLIIMSVVCIPCFSVFRWLQLRMTPGSGSSFISLGARPSNRFKG
ncbi:MAG TPA: rod shape-determining protein MreD [Desulfurivibrionaceae bacterium]|nr:rod shape-determining protein MreD [Desulfurivibrionaceae bacterium]